jgi:hypothetical protein
MRNRRRDHIKSAIEKPGAIKLSQHERTKATCGSWKPEGQLATAIFEVRCSNADDIDDDHDGAASLAFE